MTIPQYIRELVCAEAKRADSNRVHRIHFLTALTARYAADPQASEYGRKIARDAAWRKPFNGELTVDSDVEELIKRCVSWDAVADIFESLVNESRNAKVAKAAPKKKVAESKALPPPRPLKKATAKKAAVKKVALKPSGNRPADQGNPNPELEDINEQKPNQLNESFDEVLQELNSLIGLSSVKERVNQVFAMHRVNKKRKLQGLPPVEVSHHMVFTGDPGTGKTTVARIVARLYATIGMLPTGQFLEATREDLVAGYIGQTAIKTQKLIDSAMGGILFIDEAYSLSSKGQDSKDFGSEAVATLLKSMEDYRDEFAVIVAGYTKEMQSFIDSNPGLKSRFTTTIEFPNYSADELLLVFQGLCDKNQLKVTDEVLEALLKHLQSTNTGGDSGNARYVRTLFEMMFANLAIRAISTSQIKTDAIQGFLIQDVPNFANADVQEKIRNPFGFIA